MARMRRPQCAMHLRLQWYVPASLTATINFSFVSDEFNEIHERGRIMDVDVRNIVIVGSSMQTSEDLGSSGGECIQPTTRDVRLLARALGEH